MTTVSFNQDGLAKIRKLAKELKEKHYEKHPEDKPLRTDKPCKKHEKWGCLVCTGKVRPDYITGLSLFYGSEE